MKKLVFLQVNGLIIYCDRQRKCLTKKKAQQLTGANHATRITVAK